MAALTLARAYQYSFDTRPNSTLAVTGGSLTALGDVVAQVAQNTVSHAATPVLPSGETLTLDGLQIGREEHGERKAYDATRTMRFFCYGFAISA